MTPEQAILVSILICVAGAILTALVARRQALAGGIALAAAVCTAILVGMAAARVLAVGPSVEPAAFWNVAWLGFSPRFYVDGLASVFLGLAACLAVPIALYSIGYLKLRHPGQGSGHYYPCLLLFLAAMYGLVSTTDMMWFFFVFWQLMTLPGYALIRFEKTAANVRAANKYLVMMQIACVATMVGAEILVSSGGGVAHPAGPRYDFDTVSRHLPVLLSHNPAATALAFGLFLAGFGIKMGMWPFGQVWLPDAHPAAPSPMSAMLSGIMIKTGVYGLLRYFLWLVPAAARVDFPLGRWGLAVALLGTVTLFSGTMQALRQEQSKRLLAFHSIGQVGYILLGSGTCMALLASPSTGVTALAALGLAGALLHVLNHGLFKSLLFLDAGSMLCATGTQDLNRMGGLMRFMPLTGLTAIVGSFAISGVPLFNGFVSKWSIYVAAVQGSATAHYLALCALVAMLTSALTLASFVKFFGASFLSRTSALVEARARERRLEAPFSMLLPMLALALSCVVLGVFPALPFRLLERVLTSSRGGLSAALADAALEFGAPLAGVQAPGSKALLVPVALLLVLGMSFLVVVGLSALGGGRRRATSPWLCGYVREADCHRYSAHSLYCEVKDLFRWLGGTPARLPGGPAGPKEH